MKKARFVRQPRIREVNEPTFWTWRLYDDNSVPIAQCAVRYPDMRECVLGFETTTGFTVVIERAHHEHGAPVVYARATRLVVPQPVEVRGVQMRDRDFDLEEIEVEGLE